ncbi:uncharacterized protein LOC122382755 isoform X2 [Amphibalanus amphitrite]|uniref:uncharacterized protein LOC122382755 isoform X2 n=1 Tax=Amphibalanus amphitrite TaxID=1232801 RepID=UPI001C9214A8|nr:uncharacterized protein LOC122382755 isoform X2 [Amphibalanus amphitrite]
MKYPQLVSTPAVVKEWLEAELECLGIDSAAYARTVLSLLSRDTIDPAEVIQSGYVLIANKGGRGAGGLGGPHPPRTREEELKRAEVIECLRSASEDHGGIQLLVDQLISMLKQLPASSEPSGDTASDSSRRPATGDPPPPDDPVLRYEAAFPALGRGSPGVIPLTYFSKMGRAAAPAAAGLWRADLAPAAAVWPTTLDHLRLLLPQPSEQTAPLEPAGGAPAPPTPPPKPPEPAETARIIRPSAETHFQPIRRASGDDGGEDWPPPATYDARLYMRSESGGLYLEDEGPRSAAEPPQKYMIFRERPTLAMTRRGLAPKFKLSCNEKYCQTDDPATADGAGRDLLQILVSGEQAGEACGAAAGDSDDDDDSSYEVLSSLQQTLHSIYEDGSEAADSGAEPELEPDQPVEPAPARRPSAFARVRRPSPGHRPLYLRGGGADSLLAAVYTGGDWSPGDAAVSEPADHRPLYARQPTGAAATTTGEFAQHRQLTSGRISNSVYWQGPTEYPALRYQLAGRDRPEVTFCRLSGDTHRSGPLKEDPAAAWEAVSDVARSSREASVCSDTVSAGAAADTTLWQAAGERERRDRSADRALWEARAAAGRRRSSVDSAVWEQEPAAGLWEAPRGLHEPEGGSDLGALWEPAAGLAEPEDGAEPAALWETPRGLAEPEDVSELAVWETRRGRAERESSVEMTIWETSGEQSAATEAPPANIWESGSAPASGNTSMDARWAPRELVQREKSVEEVCWEFSDDLSQRDNSVEDPAADARWHVPRGQGAGERSLWESPAELAQCDRSIEEAIWEARDEPAPRHDGSTERSLWEAGGAAPQEPAPWGVPAGLARQRSAEPALWPAEPPRWEADEGSGWPAWDDPPVGAPERIWRRSEPAAGLPEWGGALPAASDGGGGGVEEGDEEEMRRLLWRLGGDDVLAQTGLYTADIADAARGWEFIDENNVKNKIDAHAGSDGGPLASELADGESGWRVLPALRQLSERLGLTEGAPLPDGVALKAWTLEEQWRRDEGPQRPARDRRVRRSDRKRPCSYFMEGNCKRNDCKFSHDLSAITCVFWEESGCFKGVHCPFLHGYPADDEEDEDSSDSAKRAVPKKSFKLEKEDFPSLHNTKKWHRNDEDDNRKVGRRNCRRHKSFSDATLGVGGGEPELPRPTIGGRGKRRRHHSKSEGVRPTDTGARRP